MEKTPISGVKHHFLKGYLNDEQSQRLIQGIQTDLDGGAIIELHIDSKGGDAVSVSELINFLRGIATSRLRFTIASIGGASFYIPISCPDVKLCVLAFAVGVVKPFAWSGESVSITPSEISRRAVYQNYNMEAYKYWVPLLKKFTDAKDAVVQRNRDRANEPRNADDETPREAPVMEDEGILNELIEIMTLIYNMFQNGSVNEAYFNAPTLMQFLSFRRTIPCDILWAFREVD